MLAVIATAGGGLSYSDTTVAANRTYTYTVRGVDAAGNAGADSGAAVVRTPLPPDTARPTAPGNVTARVVSPTRVNVSWTASTDNVGVTGYRVIRDGTALSTVGGAASGHSDTTMSSGQSHTYLVHALDQAGNVSAASNTAVAAVPAPAASGLTGTYFDTATFTAEKLTRVDPTINFAWGTGSPSTKIAADTFSVRWTGKIIPLANTNYTFYTESDNGVRLWVNGQLIINSWAAHTLKEDRGTMSLSASQAYAVKIEYYENTGPATVKLHWSSPGLTKQVIPASQLLAK